MPIPVTNPGTLVRACLARCCAEESLAVLSSRDLGNLLDELVREEPDEVQQG